ncbi:IclR family transcriptional regulator domain-containing protein [Rhizobium rhizogenes]|uniref:IclR family transcriptional regulator domain-containing protein n=1 Tax=Rhizobium rhizogenes TaxID=359 RepID=UPI001574561C|nr:IclR family transcriptional regulator C-terminal domain-containing protein [Rhizobium rhizogenes]NTI78449.1 helix-turn-helix domain-containing protein [Rhizobium rhizogenes]
MTDADTEKPFVRALSRGLHVITAMGGTAGGAALSDIAGRVDLDRATTRRILLTLESLGYVRIADKRFYLAPKVLNLGYAFLSATPLWSVSSPYLAEAAAAVAGSCSICVRDEDMLVYVARANSAKRNLAQLVEVGTRFPLYSTSAGKVLLAGMPAQRFEDYLERITLVPFTSRTITDKSALRQAVETIRGQQWAFSDQEQEDGVRSVAIALRNGRGQIVAALNASIQASRLVQDDLDGQLRDHLAVLSKMRLALEPALAAELPID